MAAADNRTRFFRTTLVLFALALLLAGVVSLPDPFTLLVYTVPLVLAALIVPYLLTYGGGFDYLDAKI